MSSIIDEIKSLYGNLSDDDFTKAGYPKVTVVETLLGKDVTSDQVKEAWDIATAEAATVEVTEEQVDPGEVEEVAEPEVESEPETTPEEVKEEVVEAAPVAKSTDSKLVVQLKGYQKLFNKTGVYSDAMRKQIKISFMDILFTAVRTKDYATAYDFFRKNKNCFLAEGEALQFIDASKGDKLLKEKVRILYSLYALMIRALITKKKPNLNVDHLTSMLGEEVNTFVTKYIK